MNPFITSKEFNQRACPTDSDDNRYPADEYESVYDEIVDNPGAYALDAIHAAEDTDDDLYSIIQFALADNRPIDERFFDIKRICEQLIESFARKEQDRV